METNGPRADARPLGEGEAVVAPLEAKQAAPLAATIRSDGRGWYLLLHYTGVLAGWDTVWARVGEHRHGQEWLGVRDIRLDRVSEEEACAMIPFEPGEPLEGAEIAFFAEDDEQEHRIWDNAGHPYGYYEIEAASGVIEAR